MAQKRPSKKTETIEVRVSPELKSALTERATGSGRTMSDLVRGAIEHQMLGGGGPQTGAQFMTRSFPLRAAQLGLALIPAVALSAVYLLSSQTPVAASAEIRAEFAFFDVDGDGAVSEPEALSVLAEDEWMPDPTCADGTAGPDEPCTIQAAARLHIERSDADGNGLVSFDEFEHVMLRERAEEFLGRDIDESGQITLDEMAASELIDLLDPEIAAAVLEEEGYALPAECRAQLEAEILDGLAATCGVERDVRHEIARFDADRNGLIGLEEFLSR